MNESFEWARIKEEEGLGLVWLYLICSLRLKEAKEPTGRVESS